MQTIDHFKIGIILAERYFSETSAANRMAFIFGNIFPDINFFTYFRGVTSQHKLKGHNFECAAGYINKMFKKLERTARFGFFSYFRLGKLMHYVADSFTYPHNICFRGSLTEHIFYEEKLHLEFKKFIAEHSLDELYFNFESSEIREKFTALHDSYLQNTGTCSWDIVHILLAADFTAEALAPSTNPILRQHRTKHALRLCT